MTPDTTRPPVKEALKVCLTDGARRAMLMLRRPAGVSLPPIPLKLSIPYQKGTDCRPVPAVRGASVRGRVSSVPLKKANGLALPMGCPSLTSRGRLLTGGVEVLIRTSNDEERVGRRYGIRMKSMTTGPYLSLPSLRVPASGGSKEAACLMDQGDWDDLSRD
jgi:hypothetical protein